MAGVCPIFDLRAALAQPQSVETEGGKQPLTTKTTTDLLRHLSEVQLDDSSGSAVIVPQQCASRDLLERLRASPREGAASSPVAPLRKAPELSGQLARLAQIGAADDVSKMQLDERHSRKLQQALAKGSTKQKRRQKQMKSRGTGYEERRKAKVVAKTGKKTKFELLKQMY
ncbi:unnamed protein product [Phaeothamnion confervicola]